MDCLGLDDSSPANAYLLLLKALSLMPHWHYLIGAAIGLIVFLYNFLEIHFLEDAFSGFRGSPVELTYNSCTHLYEGVISKCRLLHGRQLFSTSDGGTIALDWLLSSEVSNGAIHMDNTVSEDDNTPLLVVIPGLSSDSSSAYIKHLAFNTAKRGWNVVICNHRGLGGVAITSDCFYNAGWTEDVRTVINHIHQEHPKAPLFLVGTSIGANMLLKYLGEEGENIPVAGAVAICCPFDLLIGDRFMNRRLVQKLYGRAIASGLQGYAQLHHLRLSRLVNWEAIAKSRSTRDFDNHATRIIGKYKTVDAYYRSCSSAIYLESVSVPLLCVTALDDPICTKEAIPWDECRANQNVVLATVKHGGHLAFFEGITGSSLWWVRAANEFLSVLHSSKYMHVLKKVSNPNTPLESSIDQGPCVNVTEDGPSLEELHVVQLQGNIHHQTHESVPQEKFKEQDELVTDADFDNSHGIKRTATTHDATALDDVVAPLRKYMVQFSRQNRWSILLLVYVAITTSWPLVGSALRFVFRKKPRETGV
ncbi:hypothetical protein L6164_007475 [Bauhinia variegata]|uniref:Uncharacterized protein n=1 Tax=Bauhinia variegata TaxID=167791 RepID=A0ACB9PEU4_BAUVA|nr:hypothetical protein L6164_007475 [Bauhinia variegata]